MPWAVIKNGALYRLLSRADLKLLDVGARRGPMLQLAPLAPWAHYFACEPDVLEAERLSAKLKEDASWRSVTFIHEAISSGEEHATLYITKQPGLSSLLQPNEAIVKRYYRNDEFQIISTASVSTISLDHAAERYDFCDACFLKLDTQGTELDILMSGKRLLQEALLGVYVEVEFHPFYAGQPLFSDVDTYLRKFGFSLFDLHRSCVRRASYRDHLYSRRQVVWAHALYLREPEVILQFDDETALLKASRLLALGMIFEHYDLALELTTLGRSAALFYQAYGDQLHEEVERFVQGQTKVISRLAKSRRFPPDLTAFSYKDRDYIYR